MTQIEWNKYPDEKPADGRISYLVKFKNSRYTLVIEAQWDYGNFITTHFFDWLFGDTEINDHWIVAWSEMPEGWGNG